MQSLRRRRHAFVRLALIAMLALACVPTLSRWLVASGGPLAWAQVCTPQGMKTLADAEGGASGQGAHIEVCGYCTLGAGAPLPAPGPALQVALRAGAMPAASLPTPPARHAWTVAQPRAPPARS